MSLTRSSEPLLRVGTSTLAMESGAEFHVWPMEGDHTKGAKVEGSPLVS